ncbi:outer membrane protein [Paracoccus salsus]|uniref:outer membrane protein n=1 Tax=Paracoccus salsus TaxID=2911061 RepID=UPI001F1896BE|nr:outer membrane beta-barrel protein [Paracoccus salsus]MCF3974302.1 outer membrane beta-barrel protein [Paracoccus salsus]
MASKFTVSACATIALFVASGSTLAGGYIAPTTESPLIPPVAVPVPASDWAGAYLGGSIGYAFGSDDTVGYDFLEAGELVGSVSDVAQVDVKGVNAGLHAGYRWQRNSWVFGPELWVEAGSIDATDSFSFDDDGETITGTVESSVNYIVGLQMKTGYVVNPETLVYGTAGLVYGDFDYTTAGPDGSSTQGYDANGYSVGLGVERKLNARTSVFAEWQYRNFGKTDVSFPDGADSLVTRATPEHHNIKLGVNFAF